MIAEKSESRTSVMDKGKSNDTASSSSSTNLNKKDDRGNNLPAQKIDGKPRPAAVGTILNQTAAPANATGKINSSNSGDGGDVAAKQLNTPPGVSVNSKDNVNATVATLNKEMALVDIDGTATSTKVSNSQQHNALPGQAVDNKAKTVTPLAETKCITPAATADTAKSSKQVGSGTQADDSSFYDEIEIEDMDFDEELEVYHYPCPCGDRFEISIVMLEEGEYIAKCPSCSLLLKVIYDADEFGPGDDDEVIELSTTIRVC
ncbi:Diphthamide biosynthesis protein 3 [Coemansia guatemalensis]|uniref:Diphthamide biosynthesis protein 3 n=1 Tax=Coemansia guatemalensis TaxID=2761395 RepID=A0A9W8I0H7_9FUNG|nr:Diphthamide biosynthesis protein 3 [Coemansia guatemalensis]